MASKEQIKQHIALTSKIKFDNMTVVRGEDPRKMKIMEHIKKSIG
jgi:hypothetical protein